MSLKSHHENDANATDESSRNILIQGFGFILLVIIIMAIVWFYMITETQKQIDEILEEQVESLAVFKMRDAAYQRALILHRMALLDDEFDRDEEHLLFKEKAGDFIKAREQFLEAMADDPLSKELAIWQKALPDIRKGSQIQGIAAEYLLNGEMEKANLTILNEVVPTQNRVMAILTELMEEQRKETELTVKNISEQNHFALIVMTLLATGAVLWGLWVGFYTIKRTSGVERSLHEARQRAQDADKHKSQFLANMSHEIRTPLTAIIGFSETLIEEEKTDNWKSYLDSIIRNGKHLHQLINDILDLSKIEANQLNIEQIPVSVCQLLTEIDSLMGERARNKGLHFEVVSQYPMPEEIISDPTRLKQILINLCGNAIKFTAEGRVTLRAQYEKETNQMAFCVQDSGIGMSPEQLTELFTPFKQADASTTRKYGGTGLGLYISKQLAENLGGGLSVDSLQGVGSRFTVTIDAGEISQHAWINSKQEALTIVSTRQNITEVPALKGKILLAEDNPDNQRLISIHIQKTGATVEVVENGKLAVERGIAQNFDLILMDMQMPIMGGIEAIIKLRKANCTTPIATLTANAMVEDRQKSEQAGATDFLTKPIDKEKFYSTLKKYLEPESVTNEKQPTTLNKNDDDYDIQDLIKRYVEQLPETCYRIMRLIEAKEWNGVKNEIHQLKGTGGAFGLPEITKQCGIIEAKMKIKVYDEASDLIANLQQYCEKIALEQSSAQSN